MKLDLALAANSFEESVSVVIAVGVAGLLAGLDPVQGRLGDVKVPSFNKGNHSPVEKGEEQGADVGAIYVGVGHYYYLVVAELGEVELLPLSCSKGGDHGPDLLVAQDLVGLSEHPFYVEDFAFQGQDSLEAPVPPHLCGATC